MGFSRQNTGVGCHFLLQGIFPTQGSNPGLLHWRQNTLPSEPPGKSLDPISSLFSQFFCVECFNSWSYFVVSNKTGQIESLSETIPNLMTCWTGYFLVSTCPLLFWGEQEVPMPSGYELSLSSVQFSSVAQSCPTLCDPMNRSTPGLPVHHQLPEFTQTHVHRVGDVIQPFHPLSSPSPPAPSPSQRQGLFQWVNSSHEVAKVLEFQLQHLSFQWTPRTDLL